MTFVQILKKAVVVLIQIGLIIGVALLVKHVLVMWLH